MKPDSYMPVYGNELIQAVKGRSKEIKWGYFCACWHYWHHTHCTGLEDDDDFLRDVCDNPKDWDKAKSIIFDNEKFFCLGEDGKWHQKRASEEWQKSLAKYNKQLERTKAATNARWKRKGKHRA